MSEPDEAPEPAEPAEPALNLNLGALLEQAQAMQQKVVQAREEAADQEFQGQAGGGVVKVTVTGGMEFRDVTIDPSAVDPEDVQMLEDLVLAAVRDAVVRANEATEKAMGSIDLGPLAGGLFGG